MNPDSGLIEREWINSSKLSIDEAEVTAEDSRHGCPPCCCKAWVPLEPQALEMYQQGKGNTAGYVGEPLARGKTARSEWIEA